MLVLCCHAIAAELENGLLRVVVAENGSLSVTDKRSGRIWQQTALSPEFVAMGAPQAVDGRVEFLLAMEGDLRKGGQQAATFKASLSLDADKAEVLLRLEPAADVVAGEWQKVRYPFVFLPPNGPSPRILYPHGEGMLIPASRKDPDFIAIPDQELYGGTLSYLNCVGTLEMESGAGMLAIPEPFESAMLYWPKLKDDAVGFQHGWLSSRYKIDRAFSLRWLFVDKGGYVAMAKAYRGWSHSMGWNKTLREKAGENPEVNKLVGAPVFWAYGDAQQLDKVVETLVAKGIKRCVLGLDQRLYYGMLEPTPAQHAERRAVVEKARAAGFLVHHYDNYRDAFARDEKEFPWFQINMDAYPHDIVVRENGQLLSPGFIGVHQTVVGGVITPGAFLKYARIRLANEARLYPWNARFIDCVGSCAFKLEGEDYHPERMDTDMYYTRKQREELMKFVYDSGQVTGTECGLDYLIPYTCWFDGAMTLTNYVNMPPGTFALQSANADGSKSGQSSPDEAPPGGGKPFSLSESLKYRLPFWSLVHHDHAVVTWRWEHGMHAPMEHWRRKLLLNLLHGTPALYCMEYREFTPVVASIAATEAVLAPWLERVAFAEMLGHRFVTADRSVQMTWFSSGTGVVVNFGAKPYALPTGKEIPPEGYAFFEGMPGADAFPENLKAAQALSPVIGARKAAPTFLP